MKTIAKCGLVLSASLLFSIGARSQSYSISWDVIANGGGGVSGGSYSVNSTIGQDVAGGSLTGGGFSMASGFWAIYELAVTGPPFLSILLSDTNTVVIAWPATSTSWTLQQNTDLASGAWLSLSNTVNTVNGQNVVVLPATSVNCFYRLQGP